MFCSYYMIWRISSKAMQLYTVLHCTQFWVSSKNNFVAEEVHQSLQDWFAIRIVLWDDIEQTIPINIKYWGECSCEDVFPSCVRQGEELISGLENDNWARYCWYSSPTYSLLHSNPLHVLVSYQCWGHIRQTWSIPTLWLWPRCWQGHSRWY